MHFRSYADLHNRVIASLHVIPQDVDVVIGIPRSGMMAGSIIALASHLPLADAHGFAEGRLLSSGSTRSAKSLAMTVADCRHALVVDDSIDTGGSMQQARTLLEKAWPEKRFTFCAIYGNSGTLRGETLVLETVPQPRFFEWNVMHHSLLVDACVDIDGVLCLDPTRSENDDGPLYEAFIAGARPLYTPRKFIGEIVTSRLERYRALTERWLADRGIEYGRLVMLDLPDAHTRRMMGNHGSFKGEHYRRSRAKLFIESEYAQAKEIARLSGKPVYCTDGPQLITPELTSPIAIAHRTSSGLRTSIRRAVIGLFGVRGWDAFYRFAKRFGL